MNSESNEISTIGVLVFQGNRVLLVKHTEKAEHLTGVYGLPSGRVEKTEDFINAAAREIKEETGLQVNKNDLIPLKIIFHGEIPRKNGKIVKMSWNVFVAIKYNGTIKPSDETAPEWVDVDQISKLNLLPNTEEAVREGLRIMHNT